MDDEIIRVWRPGTKVLAGEIPGVIVDVSITACQQIQYKVAWWDGRDRKTQWMEAFEVRPRGRDAKQDRIGFINPGER